jgi:hypothetical protein
MVHDDYRYHAESGPVAGCAGEGAGSRVAALECGWAKWISRSLEPGRQVCCRRALSGHVQPLAYSIYMPRMWPSAILSIAVKPAAHE